MPREFKLKPYSILPEDLKIIKYRQNPPTPGQSTIPPPRTPYQQQCTDRLNALTDFCLEEYNIEPVHTRLITSALVPSSHMPVWMIYETTRTPFWNHLNAAIKEVGLPALFNIAGVRMATKKTSQRWYEALTRIRHDCPKIFIDTQCLDTRKWAKCLGPGHGYWSITAECGRASVPALMLKMPRAGAEEELARLLRMVLDMNGRRVFPEPIHPSAALADVIAALPVLNEELAGGETLFTMITLLPSCHAALYGRTNAELADPDYYSMMEVVRGSIRRWMKAILSVFVTEDAKCRNIVRSEAFVRGTGLSRFTLRYQLDAAEQRGIVTRKPSKEGTTMRKGMFRLTEVGEIGAAVVGGGMNARWW